MNDQWKPPEDKPPAKTGDMSQGKLILIGAVLVVMAMVLLVVIRTALKLY